MVTSLTTEIYLRLPSCGTVMIVWRGGVTAQQKRLTLKEASGEKAFGLPLLRAARAAQRLCPQNGGAYGSAAWEAPASEGSRSSEVYENSPKLTSEKLILSQCLSQGWQHPSNYLGKPGINPQECRGPGRERKHLNTRTFYLWDSQSAVVA